MTKNPLAGQTYRKGSGRGRVLADPADNPIKFDENKQLVNEDASDEEVFKDESEEE